MFSVIELLNSISLSRNISRLNPSNIVSDIAELMLTLSVDGPLNDNESDKKYTACE